MLIGAGACLLALLVVLLQLVESTPSRAATSRDPVESSPGAASHPVAPVAPAAPTVGRRVSSSPQGDHPVASMPSTPTPGATQATTPAGDSPPAANPQNLHYGGSQLRAQTAAIEPLLKKCLEAEVAAGRSPTGTAMLTYIIAKRGEKFVVEDVGIDEEKTTLQGESLLGCLRDTSRAMQFVGLPKAAEALSVNRQGLVRSRTAHREQAHRVLVHLSTPAASDVNHPAPCRPRRTRGVDRIV